MNTIQDFARKLAEDLRPYLAIGLTPKDIEHVIVAAMKQAMKEHQP